MVLLFSDTVYIDGICGGDKLDIQRSLTWSVAINLQNWVFLGVSNVIAALQNGNTHIMESENNVYPDKTKG